MAIMVYFKDETGAELPFSGTAFAWCGAFAPGRKNARTQIEVRRGAKTYMITSDTFGGKEVTVKIWGSAMAEYFKLVPGPVEQIDRPVEWVAQ